MERSQRNLSGRDGALRRPDAPAERPYQSAATVASRSTGGMINDYARRAIR
jgi:hypothetical protein